jgi:hypothetical protein
MNYLKHVFRCRILDIHEEKTQILSMPDELVLKTYSYLGLKELFKMASLSTEFIRSFEDHKLWHRLYISQFRNPGFKFNKVNWKKVYLQKIK